MAQQTIKLVANYFNNIATSCQAFMYVGKVVKLPDSCKYFITFNTIIALFHSMMHLCCVQVYYFNTLKYSLPTGCYFMPSWSGGACRIPSAIKRQRMREDLNMF